ncbi:MAG: hypothetical protein IJ788_04845, partial [Oscillospiraceae bacterium]|nr:hypothetical protein [Oscillospiraceae bacterium]
MPRKKAAPDPITEEVNADAVPDAEAVEAVEEIPAVEAPAEEPAQSEHRSFYDLDFHELDRDLTPEQRQEWNSIYASFR